MEPESLAAWQTGKYAFMRNWPYAYALSEDTDKLKGKFKVAPLPEFEGAGHGGHPRRRQQRDLRLLEEPGRRARRWSTSSPRRSGRRP